MSRENLNANSREILSRNIQDLMQKKGVRVSGICKDIDMPYSTVSDWIKCRKYPRIEAIEKLAQYFGVEPYEITSPKQNNDEEENLLKTFRSLSEASRIVVIITMTRLMDLEERRNEASENVTTN